MRFKFFFFLAVLISIGVLGWVSWNKMREGKPSLLPTSYPVASSPWPFSKPQNGFEKLMKEAPLPTAGFILIKNAAGVFQSWADIDNSRDKYLFLGSSLFSWLLYPFAVPNFIGLA